jgi:Interleukin-like EMT inducer
MAAAANRLARLSESAGIGGLLGLVVASVAVAAGCRTDEQGLTAGTPIAPPPGSGTPATEDPLPPQPAGATQPPAACTVGQVHCSGRIPQVCGPDGSWVNGPACAYACQGGCVNRFAAVSSGAGSPTSAEGVAEFARNSETFFSERGGLLGARGFNVAVLDPCSGEPLEPVRNFDPWATPLTDNALEELADYLEALEAGRVLMIAVCDDAGLTNLGSCTPRDAAAVTRVVQTLQRMGSEQIANYCFRGAWSFVTVTGNPQPLAEKLSRGPKVTAEAMLPAQL